MNVLACHGRRAKLRFSDRILRLFNEKQDIRRNSGLLCFFAVIAAVIML
jgi:hypothetical protein